MTIKCRINGIEYNMSTLAHVCGISRQRFFQLLRGKKPSSKPLTPEQILARYAAGKKLLGPDHPSLSLGEMK